jgi:hypothetical protein
MPYVQPGRGDVHVNGPLTNVSVAFMQEATHFVASRAFPVVPVQKQSDLYFTYDRGHFNRDMMRRRAPATESAGVSYEIATDSYSATVWAEHKDVDDQVRANADAPISLDTEATQFLTQQAMISREVQWMANYFVTGVWANDVAPGNKWDAASSTPIEDMRLGRRTILQNTGKFANKAVMTRNVFDVLLDHVDLVARIDRGQTPGGPARTNAQNLAALFELDEVMVADGIQNTANEGATNVHAFISGSDGCLLLHAPSSPGLMTPSAGYTFAWAGFVGGSAGTRIKRFRMEHLASDRIEIEQAYDQKVVSADLGYFLNDVLT